MKIGRGYTEYNEMAFQKESIKPKTTAKNQTAADKAVDIQLSETSQKLWTVSQKTEKNAERIAALKQAIQQGNYAVSAEEIADKMLAKSDGGEDK